MNLHRTRYHPLVQLLSWLLFLHTFQPWICTLGIQGLICLVCCGVIFSLRKDIRADYSNTIRHFRFLILFTAVFFLGSSCPYVVAILVLAAFVYGLRDTLIFIIAPEKPDLLSGRKVCL